MLAHEQARDGQAEAEAAEAMRRGFFSLRECIEDERQFLGGDAEPGIGNGDLPLA